MRAKRVLFGGTPGVRKSEALARLREAVREVAPDERVFTLDVDSQHLVPLLDKALYGKDPVPYLRAGADVQEELWRKEFSKLRGQFACSEKDLQFVGMHLTYRYRQIPTSAVNFSDLVAWRPDCIVTFIDDAYCVRERVRAKYPNFGFAELMLWRTEELFVGDLLARAIDGAKRVPHYLVSVRHSPMMLARLLVGGDKVASVYTSFRMSDVRGNSAHKAAIDAFRERIHSMERLAVFDPITIDELPPILRAKASTGDAIAFDPRTERWHPVASAGGIMATDDDLHRVYPLKLPRQELVDIADMNDAQLRQRDLRLVEQSDALVIFRPTLGGDRNLSEGVYNEMRRATELMHPIIWYVKQGEDPMPQGPFKDFASGADPDFICEPTEDRFWERLAALPERLRDNSRLKARA